MTQDVERDGTNALNDELNTNDHDEQTHQSRHHIHPGAPDSLNDERRDGEHEPRYNHDSEDRAVQPNQLQPIVGLRGERDHRSDRARTGERGYAEWNNAHLGLLLRSLLLTPCSPVARFPRLEHVASDTEEDQTTCDTKRIRRYAEESKDVSARETKGDKRDNSSRDSNPQCGRALLLVLIGRGRDVERYRAQRIHDREQRRECECGERDGRLIDQVRTPLANRRNCTQRVNMALKILAGPRPNGNVTKLAAAALALSVEVEMHIRDREHARHVGMLPNEIEHR